MVSRTLDTLSIVVFHMLLPTLDVYSDLLLILSHLFQPLQLLPEYSGQQLPSLGLLLLLPALASYLLTWLAWASLEEHSAASLLFPALSCYPQYRAARLLRLLWSDQADRLEEERRVLERELVELEAMVEAVPSVLVMSLALAVTGGAGIITDGDGRSLDPFSPEVILFLVTFLTSIASATLGLARCLVSGPCRVLPQLASPWAALLFLSMGATYVGKGCCLVWLPSLPSSLALQDQLLLLLGFTFLPQLLLSLLSTMQWGSWWVTATRHPSLLLLPVFTYYTFSSTWRPCRGTGSNQVTIKMSPRCTSNSSLHKIAMISSK